MRPFTRAATRERMISIMALVLSSQMRPKI